MREASRHNHVGFMVYTGMAAWCTGCGQRWKRYVTKAGNLRGWTPE